MIKKILISSFLSINLFASSVNCTLLECQATDVVSFLGYKLYTATYTVSKNSESMFLKYHISVPKEKNNKKIIEKFTQNNKIDVDDYNRLQEWVSKTIDAKDGSTYFVKSTPESSLLYINNKEVLKYTDKGSFAKKVLKIWTGVEPVDEEFKKEILALKAN